MKSVATMTPTLSLWSLPLIENFDEIKSHTHSKRFVYVCACVYVCISTSNWISKWISETKSQFFRIQQQPRPRRRRRRRRKVKSAYRSNRCVYYTLCRRIAYVIAINLVQSAWIRIFPESTTIMFDFFRLLLLLFCSLSLCSNYCVGVYLLFCSIWLLADTTFCIFS